MLTDALPLTAFSSGKLAHIYFMALEEREAQKLRDLGVREGCRVCVLMNADKCILGVDACRIALRRETAQQLFATPA